MARDARLLPDNAALQYRYGLALYLNGDREEAERVLASACRLEPDNDQFLLALVLFHQKYKRYDIALENARRLVALRPENAQYAEILADVDAEKTLAAACQLNPDDERALLALVQFLDQRGRYDEALEAVQQLVALRPGNPQYATVRAEIEQKQKDMRGE